MDLDYELISTASTPSQATSFVLLLRWGCRSRRPMGVDQTSVRPTAIGSHPSELKTGFVTWQPTRDRSGNQRKGH